MINFDFSNDCCGCSACAQICPQNCISMPENEEGFWIPDIDVSKCVNCGLCEKVCPVINSKSETPNDNYIPDKVYAAYNKNESVRLTSSSGGIFIVLAEYTLKNGGIVFGAKLSEDCRSVYHCSAEDYEDVLKFSGSKYVQSDINGTYKDVKLYLESGRLVLFSGTPCQIEGLLCFLQKKYVNLICMDFICHGVPSPKVWRKYIEYAENINTKILYTYFRDKSNGWKNASLKIDFSNGEKQIELLNKNVYGSAFLSDLCLRNSCYNCKFRKSNHKSDITVCDFWGIDEVAPELNDDKGISALILNSPIGKEIFDKIQSNLIYKQVDFYSAEKHNAILKQPQMHKNRKRFFYRLDSMDLSKNVKKNIHRHSVFLRIPYNAVKYILKTILGENGFSKLKKFILK